MKSFIIIAFLITSFFNVFGQTNNNPIDKEAVVIRLDGPPHKTNPLIILHIDGKKFESISDNNTVDNPILKQLKPEWIESISVLKNKKETDKYGNSAKDGVILVFLKKESWVEMFPELKSKFK